jgi:hypothetical protein
MGTTMFDKINDGKGNTFHPSRDQNMLAKAGWRVFERKKRGCMWIIRWIDPSGTGVWPQGTAVEIQRHRTKSIGQEMTEFIDNIDEARGEWGTNESHD